jgi:hypothetical protein
MADDFCNATRSLFFYRLIIHPLFRVSVRRPVPGRLASFGYDGGFLNYQNYEEAATMFRSIRRHFKPEPFWRDLAGRSSPSAGHDSAAGQQDQQSHHEHHVFYYGVAPEGGRDVGSLLGSGSRPGWAGLGPGDCSGCLPGAGS